MNNWLDENREQIEYYVSSKDVILVEREKQLLIMLDVFNAYFDRKSNLTFLDLGCGDGALTQILYNLYPDNTFHLLKHGGLFINIDVVLPASLKTESIQFKMWVDAINEKLKTLKREKEIGTHDGLPVVYKQKPENKPSSLTSQLHMLRETGFRDVECWFKQGIFASFGGIK